MQRIGSPTEETHRTAGEAALMLAIPDARSPSPNTDKLPAFTKSNAPNTAVLASIESRPVTPTTTTPGAGVDSSDHNNDGSIIAVEDATNPDHIAHMFTAIVAAQQSLQPPEPRLRKRPVGRRRAGISDYDDPPLSSKFNGQSDMIIMDEEDYLREATRLLGKDTNYHIAKKNGKNKIPARNGISRKASDASTQPAVWDALEHRYASTSMPHLHHVDPDTRHTYISSTPNLARATDWGLTPAATTTLTRNGALQHLRAERANEHLHVVLGEMERGMYTALYSRPAEEEVGRRAGGAKELIGGEASKGDGADGEGGKARDGGEGGVEREEQSDDEEDEEAAEGSKSEATAAADASAGASVPAGRVLYKFTSPSEAFVSRVLTTPYVPPPGIAVEPAMRPVGRPAGAQGTAQAIVGYTNMIASGQVDYADMRVRDACQRLEGQLAPIDALLQRVGVDTHVDVRQLVRAELQQVFGAKITVEQFAAYLAWANTTGKIPVPEHIYTKIPESLGASRAPQLRYRVRRQRLQHLAAQLRGSLGEDAATDVIAQFFDRLTATESPDAALRQLTRAVAVGAVGLHSNTDLDALAGLSAVGEQVCAEVSWRSGEDAVPSDVAAGGRPGSRVGKGGVVTPASRTRGSTAAHANLTGGGGSGNGSGGNRSRATTPAPADYLFREACVARVAADRELEAATERCVQWRTKHDEFRRTHPPALPATVLSIAQEGAPELPWPDHAPTAATLEASTGQAHAQTQGHGLSVGGYMPGRGFCADSAVLLHHLNANLKAHDGSSSGDRGRGTAARGNAGAGTGGGAGTGVDGDADEGKGGAGGAGAKTDAEDKRTRGGKGKEDKEKRDKKADTRERGQGSSSSSADKTLSTAQSRDQRVLDGQRAAQQRLYCDMAARLTALPFAPLPGSLPLVLERPPEAKEPTVTGAAGSSSVMGGSAVAPPPPPPPKVRLDTSARTVSLQQAQKSGKSKKIPKISPDGPAVFTVGEAIAAVYGDQSQSLRVVSAHDSLHRPRVDAHHTPAYALIASGVPLPPNLAAAVQGVPGALGSGSGGGGGGGSGGDVATEADAGGSGTPPGLSVVSIYDAQTRLPRQLQSQRTPGLAAHANLQFTPSYLPGDARHLYAAAAHLQTPYTSQSFPLPPPAVVDAAGRVDITRGVHAGYGQHVDLPGLREVDPLPHRKYQLPSLGKKYEVSGPSTIAKVPPFILGATPAQLGLPSYTASATLATPGASAAPPSARLRLSSIPVSCYRDEDSLRAIAAATHVSAGIPAPALITPSTILHGLRLLEAQSHALGGASAGTGAGASVGTGLAGGSNTISNNTGGVKGNIGGKSAADMDSRGIMNSDPISRVNTERKRALQGLGLNYVPTASIRTSGSAIIGNN